jgi:hypothetical protein
LIYVSAGISDGGRWMSVRKKTHRSGEYRIKTKALPLRTTPEEAQADLDAYALNRGWDEAE